MRANETAHMRKRLLNKFLMHLLTLSSNEVSSADLAASALVFSPHPDDECLGCGGTIIKKKRAGATVKLVHMTDGSKSHPDFMCREDMRALRGREALNAAAALEVDQICFLDFEDSALTRHLKHATDRVAEILRQEEPEEVFIPYLREPVRQAEDHIATTNIVLAALRSYPGKVTIWEYPIWFWLHWPWVGWLQKDPYIRTRHIAKNSAQQLLGLRAFTELRQSIDISDVLDEKMAALAEHRSQMTQLVPNAAWSTLGRISKGQFLECFYGHREFFRRSIHPGNFV
jgi:LmbE family N-acetylglucosaminyl deacetylase